MFSRFAVSTLLLSLVLASPCLAADVNFYSLKDQWANNKPEKTDKNSAIEEGFSKAFQNRTVREENIGVVTLPPVRRTLQEAVSASGGVEIEFNQTLIVDGIGGLVKFITTDEGLAILENVDADTLKILGTGIGTTFVHVWNPQGRSTFTLRVTQPKVTVSREQVRQRETLDKSRPFRLNYDNARSASYNGDKFRDAPRSSVDFSQNFGLSGDTPYGEASAHMLTQKARGKLLLTDAQVELKDGKIGRFDNFNATFGDKRVEPAFIVFPAARVRGGDVEHWSDDKRLTWDAFHGRENNSIFGTLTPGVESKRTLNSDLSGVSVDYRINDKAKVRTGVFSGSGRSRSDELNKAGYGFDSEVNIGEHHLLENETDFDNEKFAHKHSFTTRYEKLRVRHEFRDISKKFFTLVGPPTRQGEAGYILDVNATPSQQWAFTGTFDIFKDRLIPNPEAPDRLNAHTDLALNYYPCDEVNYSWTLQDMDDTGRLGPSRFRNLGFQYNERFDFWGRKATFFTRFNHRTNHTLTNSLNDYRQDQAVLGLYTSLFWGINFSLQKEWSALEDVEVSRYTHPAALIYTFDTNRQLWDTPFFAEARLRIRDEEETESVNSFMAGEDSTEISGGFFYREYEDLELFLTGSFTQYVPEGLSVTDARIEAQFYTGMRCSFDTGFRWGATGDFEGYVFKDANGNGQIEEGEPGMSGMGVQSSDGKEATTDENGYYKIPKVMGKKAVMTLDSTKIPYGFVPTGNTALELDIIQKKAQRADFGLVPRSDVTGIVFNDLNGDGKYQSAEPGVGKVKILLEKGETARTSPSGVYTFSNIMAGEHTASLSLSTLPEGYVPILVPKKSFTLFEGVRYELPFPLKAQHVVTGRVFRDENRDGVLDEKDVPLAGVKVSLDKQSMDSDKDGWYLFDEITPGDYTLSLAEGKPVKIKMPAEPKIFSEMNLPVLPPKKAEEAI